VPVGAFLYPALVPTKLSLEDTISSLKREEKRVSLDCVIKNMVCWAPEPYKNGQGVAGTSVAERRGLNCLGNGKKLSDRQT